MLNFALLRGRLSSPVDQRTLPSGATLATLQITTRPDDGPAVSVPVAWFDPPAWAADLEPDDDVIVLGTVKRRFFRAGGATASRVEVLAESVARGNDSRRRRAIVKRITDRAADLDA
jgi:single-strand DNA-binding protein